MSEKSQTSSWAGVGVLAFHMVSTDTRCMWPHCHWMISITFPTLHQASCDTTSVEKGQHLTIVGGCGIQACTWAEGSSIPVHGAKSPRCLLAIMTPTRWVLGSLIPNDGSPDSHLAPAGMGRGGKHIFFLWCSSAVEQLLLKSFLSC